MFGCSQPSTECLTRPSKRILTSNAPIVCLCGPLLPEQCSTIMTAWADLLPWLEQLQAQRELRAVSSSRASTRIWYDSAGSEPVSPFEDGEATISQLLENVGSDEFLAVWSCPFMSSLPLAMHTLPATFGAAQAGHCRLRICLTETNASDLVLPAAGMLVDVEPAAAEGDRQAAPAGGVATASPIIAQAATAATLPAPAEAAAPSQPSALLPAEAAALASAPANPPQQARAPATTRQAPPRGALILERGADLTQAVRAVLAAAAPTGGCAAASLPLQGWLCTPGPAVPPTGELQGNCAFASLLRSSGAVFPSARAEKAACGDMRRAVVAANLRRVLLEPSFADTIAAVNASSDGAGGSDTATKGGGGRATGSKQRKASAFAAGADAAEGLDPAARSALGYLQGQLSSSPTLASQYAGPLELAALADLLRRDILVFAERGSADDGALFTPQQPGSASEGCGGDGGVDAAAGCLPPLAAVNTRRRHMYPLVFGPASGPHTGGKPPRSAAGAGVAGANAITEAHLAAMLSRAVARLACAVEERSAAAAGGADALGAAVAHMLRDIQRSASTPL